MLNGNGKGLFRRLGGNGRRKFRRGAGFVVDDHHEIEIGDDGRRAGALFDIGAPGCIVTALRRLFRRPNIKRAAGAVFAGALVLADQLFVAPPLHGRRARVFQYLLAGPGGRIFELDVLDDHRSVSLSLLLL